MPSCNSCHRQLHGEKHSQCLTCHQNPHAAQQAPGINQIVNLCSDCHSEQNQQLEAFPSQHTELSCDYCHHTEHGLIPFCGECHQPHFGSQSFSSCSNCHDVHQPLEVKFGENIELKTCEACHSDVYSQWQGTASKHGEVSCSSCHESHKQIPQCLECHTIPTSHSKTLLNKYPRCLECHLDVHDLPVKN